MSRPDNEDCPNGKLIYMEAIYQKLINYSYHIVGSYEDAKDLVQDTVEKYISLDKSIIENEVNYLIRSVINHSINFKKKKNTISKYGMWLPEPVSTDTPDKALHAEDIASYSMMVLMERLNAKERAVFVLKEGFNYSHDEISETLTVSVVNSRKLLNRAKGKLKNSSFQVYKKPGTKSLIADYIAALQAGDTSKLSELLKKDIQFSADGGEHIQVVTTLTIGSEKTIDLLQYVYRAYQRHLRPKVISVNNQPAIIYYSHDSIVSCQIFEINQGEIEKIYSVVDPEKLKNLKF